MTEHHPASEGGAAHGPAPDERRLRVGDLHWREVADALWLVREHPGLVAPDPARIAAPARETAPGRAGAPDGASAPDHIGSADTG
ncbi:MAG: hypothetical protein H5T76_21935, partial [Streptomyces sp.]|nr:hypothetical protein [Streptomyces sp.]